MSFREPGETNLSVPNGPFNFFLISVVQFKIIIVEFMSEEAVKKIFIEF